MNCPKCQEEMFLGRTWELVLLGHYKLLYAMLPDSIVKKYLDCNAYHCDCGHAEPEFGSLKAGDKVPEIKKITMKVIEKELKKYSRNRDTKAFYYYIQGMAFLAAHQKIITWTEHDEIVSRVSDIMDGIT